MNPIRFTTLQAPNQDFIIRELERGISGSAWACIPSS